MESPASVMVLREPALLPHILCHLSQQDLWRLQRVCHTWNRTISTDSRLRTIMWLHPGISTARVDEAATEINPLLLRTFPAIFKTSNFWDGFTTVVDRHSPFMDMWVAKSPQVLRTLKCPNASWRRMIPCFPAPDQLLVHVSGEERGRLLSLNFSNKGTPDVRPSHPPWLTFGLLYDLVECAWHQAKPWRLHSVRFDFPSASVERKARQDFVPLEAAISDERRASAHSRAGRVRVHLEPDSRSETERRRVHDEAVAEIRRMLDRTARQGLCGTTHAIPQEIFTDEFHFADALSLDEIDWDEAHEYGMPSREAPVIQSSPPARRFLGIRLWRR